MNEKDLDKEIQRMDDQDKETQQSYQEWSDELERRFKEEFKDERTTEER